MFFLGPESYRSGSSGEELRISLSTVLEVLGISQNAGLQVQVQPEQYAQYTPVSIG